MTMYLGENKVAPIILGPSLTGDALESEVFAGQEFYSDSFTKLTGTFAPSASDIKDGVILAGVTGTFTETTSAPTAAQILIGKTAFANGAQVDGVMPDNGSVGTQNLTTEGAEYTIAAGYHNGLGKVKAVITGLIASVIKSGTPVGGILGTFTSDATATASQILSGAIAYVNGVKVTGTLVDFGPLSSGSVVVLEATTERSNATNVYTKVKEIKVNYAGTITVSFNLKGQYGDTWAYGTIYKNGSAVGIERVVYGQTYQLFTENFTVTKDDLIQLYLKSPSGYSAISNSLQIKISPSKIGTVQTS